MRRKNYHKGRFLLLVLMFLTISSGMNAQTAAHKQVNIDVKSVPAEQVFKEIRKQTGIDFMYSADLAREWPRVTLRITGKPAIEAVAELTGILGCTYEQKGNIVTVTKQKVSGRERTIKGIVRDPDGELLPGVPICIGESRVCTVTDDEGFYTFRIPVERTSLKFSYVGMETIYAVIEPGTAGVTHNVTMRSATELKNIVVTGIFRKAKESYTGAVTSIDKGQIDLYRGANLLQTLKNIDAGLNFPINNVAGSNPNVLPNLNIRGASSLPMNVEEFNSNAQQTVNTPLVILDGFEISLQKLMDYNDEQIESINILKDAAATAIYGSRGANGVIVVVSKTPKEGKLRVTAKAGLNLELPDLSSYNMLNAAQKLELERYVGLYDAPTNPEQQYQSNLAYNTRLKDIKEGTDVDWLSKPLRNGVGQRYNIQLDGGSGEFRWGASLGYNDVEGAMRGSSRRTLTGDLTLIYSIKNLTFRNYTSIASNHSKESKYGSFADYVRQQPYNNPYDEDGNLRQYFWNYDFTNHRSNPLYDASLNTINESEYLELTDNFSIEWLITQDLRLRAKMGITTHRSSSDYFLPASHSTFDTTTYNSAAGILRKGRYTYGTGNSNLLSGNVTMSYSKTLADKHQIYVGADYSISEQHVKNMQIVAEGFTNEDVHSIWNALQYEQDAAPTGDQTTVRLVGLTGNANYTYDNRYFLDLSYRVDGSSKFGSNKRFAPFWSAGIGWNLHNEQFLKEIPVINNLRLKASYGLTGSQDFTTEDVYTTYNYPSGSSYLIWTSGHIMSLGNSDLTWQKTKEINLGLEVGLWKNRATAELNYYTKKTSNLLSEMDLPLAAGFPSYVANIGELKNHGLEASLNVYLLRDHERQFNWLVGGQIVYNSNEITRLSDAIKRQNEVYLAQNVDVSNLFYEGRPMNAIYAVRSNGIDPSTGEEVFVDKNGQVTSRWNASDKVYLGSAEPTWRGNFRSMVMWKNFTLNVSFGYHWGGKLYNQTLRDRVEVSTSTIANNNVDERVLSQRWMQPGDVTFFRNFNDNSVVNNHATSRFVFDDRMLELQSVSLQYRWNTKWLQANTHLQSVVFAINANDLLYWSSVKYERGTSYPYARNVQGTITLTL